MGNLSKVGGALVVQRVCTAEEVGKRPSGSRLLSFFPLCRPVSLSLPSRRSLKKDFARREGGGGATDARNSGISRVPVAGEEGWRRRRRPSRRDEGEKRIYRVGASFARWQARVREREREGNAQGKWRRGNLPAPGRPIELDNSQFNACQPSFEILSSVVTSKLPRRFILVFPFADSNSTLVTRNSKGMNFLFESR